MRHVLICIRSLHKEAGYLHYDLRWPNIILVGSEWYVIDNEVAEKLCNKNIATINAEEIDVVADKFKEKSRKKREFDQGLFV